MIQLFDPQLGVRRDVTPEEWERRWPDSSVPGGWRLMSVEEKAASDARLAKIKTQGAIVTVIAVGITGAIGYKVAGTKGAVIAPLALFGLALAMANR